MNDTEFDFLKNMIGEHDHEEIMETVSEGVLDAPALPAPNFKTRFLSRFKLYYKGPRKPRLPPQIVSIYFGVPGSGKTTYAAYLPVTTCGAVSRFGRMFLSLAAISSTQKPTLVTI